ncbi:MAG: DMT family transporter [Acidimicrobiales bacterium]
MSETPTARPRSVVWWSGALVVASVFWAGGGLVAKSAPMSGPQFALWRSLGGAATYQTALLVTGRRPRLAHLRAAAMGGVGFGLGVLFLFAAFKSTTLTSANVINALQPILLGIAATRLHHVVLSKAAVAAMAVAVAGTIVVVAGSTGGGSWSLHGDLLAAAGVVVSCLYPLGTKSARRTLDALEYQAACLWVSAAVCLVGVLIIDGRPIEPTASGWLSVAGIVAVGGTGHLIFSWAQHHVSVAASSVVLLVEIAVSAVGAAVFFDQPIGAVQVLGMAIVGVGIVAWVRAEAGTLPA